jgi:hypothetical protein
MIGRSAKELAPALMRRVLDEPVPPRLLFAHGPFELAIATRNLIFLKQAVPRSLDDVALGERWGEAAQALFNLQSYTFGSKQRRANLEAIARNPVLMEAAQAAAVGNGEHFDMELFALLALEGSDASVDALLPHFHRAMTTEAGLEQIEILARHAKKTPSMQAMLQQSHATLDERSQTSPALLLARHLGFGELKQLSFTVRLASTALTWSNAPVVQGSVEVDSRASRWLYVWFQSDGKKTAFNELTQQQDGHGVGRATLLELPAYLRAPRSNSASSGIGARRGFIRRCAARSARRSSIGYATAPEVWHMRFRALPLRRHAIEEVQKASDREPTGSRLAGRGHSRF